MVVELTPLKAQCLSRRRFLQRRGWWIKDGLPGQLLLAERNRHQGHPRRCSVAWRNTTNPGHVQPVLTSKIANVPKTHHDVRFNFGCLGVCLNFSCSLLQLRLVITTQGSILKVTAPSSSSSLNIQRSWSGGSLIYTRLSWCKKPLLGVLALSHTAPSDCGPTCGPIKSQTSFDLYVIDCSNELPLACIGLARQIIVGHLSR